jgi:hypothetical protein
MRKTTLRGICPFCFATVLSATSPGDFEPEQGDLAVCSNCSNVSVFDFGRRHRLRKPWRDEEFGIAKNRQVQAILVAKANGKAVTQ